MGKKRIPQYLTPEGKFDEKSAAIDRARERDRQGLVGFTRHEKFAEVMSASNQQNMRAAEKRGNVARAEAKDKEFSDQYDSAIGRGRKRAGGGKMGALWQ